MTTKPLRVDGIDLSHYQTQNIDYAAAKRAGVQFVYHKASEGTTYSDPNYVKRRAEAKANGLLFGAYHFAQPAPGNAVAEAAYFLKIAKPAPGDLLPALDLESNPHGMSNAALTSWVQTFWKTVQTSLGIKSGITYTKFDVTDAVGTYLWAPRYANDNALPYVPKAWKNFTIRQFSDGMYGVPNFVPGVGHVDLNHIRVRLGWKKRLTIPAKAVPAPVKPVPAPVVAKKTPEPQVHVVSQFNVEFGHKPVGSYAAMILQRFEDNKVDVMSINEAEDYFSTLQKLAAAKGHTLLGHGPHSRNALLVRKGLTHGPVGTVPGNVPVWRNGNHNQSMAAPVVAQVEGVTYASIHAPVAAWIAGNHGHTFTGNPDRLAAYHAFTVTLTKFIESTKGPVVVMGDWNTSPTETGPSSPAWVVAQTKAEFARPHQSTGHGEIDFGIVRGAKVGKVRVVPQPKTGDHSDHLQVVIPITV